MTFTGQVIEGKVVFDEPLPLPDGTPVRVEPLADALPPTFLERIRNAVGKADGLPEDAATNVDHYLYGHPKQ